jgi:hypothetical protein
VVQPTTHGRSHFVSRVNPYLPCTLLNNVHGLEDLIKDVEDLYSESHAMLPMVLEETFVGYNSQASLHNTDYSRLL